MSWLGVVVAWDLLVCLFLEQMNAIVINTPKITKTLISTPIPIPRLVLLVDLIGEICGIVVGKTVDEDVVEVVDEDDIVI